MNLNRVIPTGDIVCLVKSFPNQTSAYAVPTGKIWHLVSISVNRDVSSTLVVQLRNGANVMHEPINDAAATGWKTVALSPWFPLGVNQDVYVSFGTSQSGSSKVVIQIVEVPQ